MRSSTMTITLALSTALVAGGCGTDGGVHAPSKVSSAIIPAEVWDVTSTLTSVSGPACLTEYYELGFSTEWRLQVRREGTEILLVDTSSREGDIELLGSTDGEEFTASASVSGSTLSCENLQFGYDLGTLAMEARVTGRFSADGHSLTATETLTYRLTDETLELSFDWTGVRR